MLSLLCFINLQKVPLYMDHYWEYCQGKNIKQQQLYFSCSQELARIYKQDNNHQKNLIYRLQNSRFFSQNQ